MTAEKKVCVLHGASYPDANCPACRESMGEDAIAAHKRRGHLTAMHFNACPICNPAPATPSSNLRVWLSDYASMLQKLLSLPEIDREVWEKANGRFTEVTSYLRGQSETKADCMCLACGTWHARAAVKTSPARTERCPHGVSHLNRCEECD